MNLTSSPLVQYAAEAQRPTRWWLAWIVAIGLGIIVPMTVVPPIFAMVVGHAIAPGSILEQVQEIFTNGATLGVLALWVILKEKRPFSSLGFRGAKAIPTFLLGVLGGFTMFAIPVGGLLLTGQYRVVDAGTKTVGVAALVPVVLLFAVWIVQSSTEETVMRGYLLQIHAQQLPAWLAVLLPAVGFAVIHLNFNPLPLANITLVAIFFSFVALRQGSLWMVAGLHTGWNYIQGNILGIPVSGGARETSLVFLAPTDGSWDWLTGGDFGIEGGAAATVVLAALAAWSYVAFRKHQRSAVTAAATV
jgi:uncharacterized protein